MTLFTNFVTLQNGSVAEWLGRGLQNLVQRFKSARNLKKSKTPTRRLFPFMPVSGFTNTLKKQTFCELNPLGTSKS